MGLRDGITVWRRSASCSSWSAWPWATGRGAPGQPLLASPDWCAARQKKATADRSSKQAAAPQAMGTEWKPVSKDADVFEGRDRKTGALKWTGKIGRAHV